MEPSSPHALSVKQPWASLILSGRKTIEIRSWPTARRGLVYIHAGRISDNRRQGWNMVTEIDKEKSQLKGGLLGTADLMECITYRTREDFVRDQDLHLNDPAWFDGTVLYGFRFANARYLDFRPMTGWFRFFAVEAKQVELEPAKVEKA